MAIGNEEDVKGKMAAEISDLLLPGKPIPIEVFMETGRSRWAYCDLVREYYGRFGTSEDLKTLDSLPERVSFGEGVDEYNARVFRSYLREQCRQAKDSIALRLEQSH